MKTVLASAYDINPYRGSESGTGWNIIIQIAKINSVIAITRKNNEFNINRYILENEVDISNLQFEYFDLPKWAMIWKRGATFARLYFYLWQLLLPLYVRRKEIKFDIAHNVNFHTDTTPTFLWTLGRPTIWGPVNHNEAIPAQYIGSVKIYIQDRLKWFLKNCSWRMDPFIWLSIRKSSIVVGGNSGVRRRLGVPKEKFYILSTVASTVSGIRNSKFDRNVFRVVVVGRQIPIKSMDIAMRSFEKFFEKISGNDKRKVELVMLGDGELHYKLRDIASRLKCSSVIKFKRHIDYSQMNMFYAEASCLLNCSHEGAGVVIAEALSNGLPVICFDNFGAGESVDSSCSLKVRYSSLDETIEGLSSHMLRLFSDSQLLNELSCGAIKYFSDQMTWDCKGTELKRIYMRLESITN
ncbi:MAG: glycosyltransferase [Ekhidna sp.]